MEQENTTVSMHHSRMGIKVIVLLCVTAIVIIALVRERIVQQQQWQTTVIGRGEVSYSPDTARVNFGVHVDRAATAEAAFSELNGTMAKVIEAVKNAGVPDSAIRMTIYSMFPQYDFAPVMVREPTPDYFLQPVPPTQKIAGYSADQELSVKIENIKDNAQMLSKVIAEATKAGANTVNNIAFESSAVDALKNEARIKAIADAREKAVAQAQAAGIKLGKVVGWWENAIIGSMPDYAYAKGMEAGGAGIVPPTLPAGQNEIVIEVGLNFLIK